MGSLNTLCKIELRLEFALGLEPVLGQGYNFLYALQPRFKKVKHQVNSGSLR